MTEILTESFCERCGTRYTFESARPKTRLKGVKVLSRGLKNFVLSDDTSIDEAMAAARSESDREASAHQLDAFHRTFNFCMSCRQYTCPNCWNEVEARCLSCAPLALAEAPVRLEDLAIGVIGEASPGNGTTTSHEHDEWPEPVEAPGAIAADTLIGVEPESTDVDFDAAAATATESTPFDATPEFAGEPPAELASDADAASKAAAQTTGLLNRFRPGQSLDAELDAFERERSEVAPSAAAEDQPDSVAAMSEPAESVDAPLDAASLEPMVPEPVSAEALPTAVAPEPEPEPEPLAAGAGADVVEQPTWRITAPDPTGATPLPPSSEPAPAIPLQATSAPPESSGGEPQWPARPQWPGAAPAAGLPFLGRPAAGQGGIDALWAASNQELVTAAPAAGRTAVAAGIQPCVSCGLSLSATARFCRRCGTLQAR
jgi:hypothetical protein